MTANLQPCGTPAAYRRHLVNGEPACELCRVAWREAARGRLEREDEASRQRRLQSVREYQRKRKASQPARLEPRGHCQGCNVEMSLGPRGQRRYCDNCKARRARGVRFQYRPKQAHHKGAYHRLSRILTGAAKANPHAICQRPGCGLRLEQHPNHKTGRPPYWTAGHVVDGAIVHSLADLRLEASVCNLRAGAQLGNKRSRQATQTRHPLDW